MDQLHQWWFAALCLLAISVGITTPSNISVTLIENAVEKGALCLDGSPGAYYFDSGSGDGATKWIVYLKGGGWCNDKTSCLDRLPKDVGTSKQATPLPTFAAILLKSDQTVNPDFYNWNRVNVVYCDGASFMADVEEVDPKTNLYLRGGRIFRTIMEELATKGMKSATEAILAGNSAGGLATILHCDSFRSYLPQSCKVKCLADSGFFIHAPEIPGAIDRVNYFSSFIDYHKLEKLLPQSCTSKTADLGTCLFSENLVNNIETPLFLLNSAYDQYQLSHNVVPNADDSLSWAQCTAKGFESVTTCTPRQYQLILDFGKAFMQTLKALDDRPSRGLFINSCYIHDFAYTESIWNKFPVLENKTIAKAFADWYFERSPSVKLVDTEHPNPINCNITNKANSNLDTMKNEL